MKVDIDVTGDVRKIAWFLDSVPSVVRIATAGVTENGNLALTLEIDPDNRDEFFKLLENYCGGDTQQAYKIMEHVYN